MNPVRFIPPDAVVALNATLPDTSFFREVGTARLIAADGAGQQLLERGLIPERIIGDLDSLPLEAVAAVYPPDRIVHDPDQDSNDFEKCLRYCRRQGMHSILVCGMHGGEFEHSLNNWSVFIRHARDINMCVYDAGRLGIPVHKELCLATRPGEIISLIPQPAAVLSTESLRWPLQREALGLGSREGARNQALTDRISINVHEGELLLFCDARTPQVPQIQNKGQTRAS